MSINTFKQQLDTCNNELEVRERIAKDEYDNAHLGIAQEWLRCKDEARSLISTSKRDAREEETLAVAKDANSIARSANTFARSAKNISLIAAIAAIVAAIAAVIAAIK